jgi:hypothetical protein
MNSINFIERKYVRKRYYFNRARIVPFDRNARNYILEDFIIDFD